MHGRTALVRLKKPSHFSRPASTPILPGETVRVRRTFILNHCIFSFVLNFAYAEALELQGNFTDVHATFDKFLGTLRKDLEALESRVNASSSSNGSASSQQTQNNGDAPASASQQGPASNHSSFNTQSSDEKPPKNKELCDKRTDYGIAWIVYIRFARRAEGLRSARNVFGKARRDRWTPWEVHEAEGASPPSLASSVVSYSCRLVQHSWSTTAATRMPH